MFHVQPAKIVFFSYKKKIYGDFFTISVENRLYITVTCKLNRDRDLWSRLLMLDKADTSIALFSLNRNLTVLLGLVDPLRNDFLHEALLLLVQFLHVESDSLLSLCLC